MRTTGLLVLLVLVIGASAAPGMGQTTLPVSPAAGPGGNSSSAARHVKAIREANTLAAAQEAFNDGAEGDRENVELNTAYMRRLLQLGLPQFANGPAATLASTPILNDVASSELNPLSVITSVTPSDTEIPAWKPTLAVAIA